MKKLPILLLLLATPPVSADVTLPAVIGNGMMIQRDQPSAVWGWANEGETIEILLGASKVAATVGAGKHHPWKVMLPPQKAGPVADLIIKGNNRITVSNIIAGDIWLCSGQSNMVMTIARGGWCPYGGVTGAQAVVAAANDPSIRFFNVQMGRAVAPSLGLTGTWAMASPETVPLLSGTAYFFARELRQKLKVPIGLVVSADGGTAIEPWTPRSVLDGDPVFAGMEKHAKEFQAGLALKMTADQEALEGWQKTAGEARAAGAQPPPQPVPSVTPAQRQMLDANAPIFSCGILYNGKIHPFTPMTIKGVLWYQGESNARRPETYAHVLARLVEGWRKAFGRELPFLVVQLAGYGKPVAMDARLGSFALIREAQQKIADAILGVSLATAVDVGDPNNVHPANKQEVGRRLALAALNQVYGEAVAASGPVFAAASFEPGAPGRAVIRFREGGGGLQLRSPRGFELAAEDGIFMAAEARVVGNTVVVTSAGIRKPIAVRYAFHNAPECTLFNQDGLPAFPFRSDDWEIKPAEQVTPNHSNP